MSRPIRKLLRPDPFAKTWRGKLYFGALDARRDAATAWRRLARKIDGWISP